MKDQRRIKKKTHFLFFPETIKYNKKIDKNLLAWFTPTILLLKTISCSTFLLTIGWKEFKFIIGSVFLRSRKPCKYLHCGKKKRGLMNYLYQYMYTDLVSVHDQLRKFRIKISKGWNIQQPRISINLLQVSVYSTLHSMVSLIVCFITVHWDPEKLSLKANLLVSDSLLRFFFLLWA